MYPSILFQRSDLKSASIGDTKVYRFICPTLSLDFSTPRMTFSEFKGHVVTERCNFDRPPIFNGYSKGQMESCNLWHGIVRYLLEWITIWYGLGTTRGTEVPRFRTKFHENATTKMAAGTVHVPTVSSYNFLFLIIPMYLKTLKIVKSRAII